MSSEERGKQMKNRKSNHQIVIVGIVLSMLILFLVFNMNIHLDGFKDDGNLFLKPLINKFDGNYINFLVSRYNTWSSRIIIELFTLIGVTNPIIWKLLNAIIMSIAVLLPPYILMRSKDVTPLDLCLSLALFLMIPVSQFSETGWVATTTNYLWVYALGLISIYPLIRYTRQEKKINWLYYTGIITTLYAANQEQMSLLLLVFTTILCLINWSRKRSIKPLIPNMTINILTLFFILTAKGNDIRYDQELNNWFPDFNQLSFIKKIELGYSSTLRHFFFDLQLPVLLFLFLIFIFTISCFVYRKKISFVGVFGLIPFPVSLIFSLNGYLNSPKLLIILNQFNQYGTSIQVLNSRSWVPDIILTIIFFSSLVSLVYLLDFEDMAYLPLLFMCAALMSRLIMGFSPTIWASATRTYLFSYGLINLTSIYLFKNCKTFKSIKIIGFSVFLIFGLIRLFLSFRTL